MVNQLIDGTKYKAILHFYIIQQGFCEDFVFTLLLVEYIELTCLLVYKTWVYKPGISIADRQEYHKVLTTEVKSLEES